jgi:threonine dehydratase
MVISSGFPSPGPVVAAHAAIARHVLRTPCVRSHWLSTATGADVWLKLENVQVTGSFKVRGATNKLLSLSPEQRARGVIAASSGNHGLGVAHAAAALGCRATVYVPETTPASKRSAIAARGATVHVFGPDCVDTEQHARAQAAQLGATYVSPYNDVEVIAGQGTIALELLEQVPALGTVYVALGGGGLLCGVAMYGKRLRGDAIEFVACSPAASPAMDECVRRGKIVDVPCGETLSDSTAGGVEPGAITFELLRDVPLAGRYLRVDEPAIAAALLGMLEHEHLLVEGAAAVAIAACLADRERRRPGPVCVLVCGGNLPLPILRRLLGAPSAET